MSFNYQEYTSDALRSIPPGEVMHINPPVYQAMITGTTKITINRHRKVTLHYEDGSTESATCLLPERVDDLNYLDLVSKVQRKRVLR